MLQTVFFKRVDGKMEILMAGPSHFSKELTGDEFIQEKVVYAKPFRLCTKLQIPIEQIKNRILVIERGDCTFVEKARTAQEAGAKAVIVTDNVPGTSADEQTMFAMSGDGTDDVKIPVVFIFSAEAKLLKDAYDSNPEMEVTAHEDVIDRELRVARVSFHTNQHLFFSFLFGISVQHYAPDITAK